MSSKIMIDLLLKEKIPPPMLAVLRQAGSVAEENGFKLYLVGGIVRDLLLDYPLEYDYDLVVIGDAGQFAELLQQLLGGKLTLYPRYLTATLKLDPHIRIDLVTARRESYSKPAALPRVVAADLKADLYRRDFTVNALACSLMPEDRGLIYDYHDGFRDLQKKMIRVLHPTSFIDDPLRIIRAVRFEQRYSFMIEGKTLNYLEEAVKAEALALVDVQRLLSETQNICLEPDPDRVLKRLQNLGINIRH